MKSFGEYLSHKYTCSGLIEPQYTETYAYIFDYIFSFTIYNISLIFIGFIIKQYIATTVYIIITGSLRAVAGGYHCQTRFSCFLLSYYVYAIYLSFNIISISIHPCFPLLGYLICWTLIIKISPVNTPNKLFTADMVKTARKKVFILFITDSIFTISSLLLNFNKGIYSNLLSLMICTAGLYAGYYSDRRRQNESQHSNM